MFSPDVPLRSWILDPAANADLRSAWVDAIADHPRAYLRGRIGYVTLNSGISYPTPSAASTTRGRNQRRSECRAPCPATSRRAYGRAWTGGWDGLPTRTSSGLGVPSSGGRRTTVSGLRRCVEAPERSWRWRSRDDDRARRHDPHLPIQLVHRVGGAAQHRAGAVTRRTRRTEIPRGRTRWVRR